MRRLMIAGAAGLGLLVVAGGAWAIWGPAGDHVQSATASLRKGDLRTAAIELRTEVRDNPGNGQAHLMLSEVQLLQGDAVAAERSAKTARDLGADKVAATTLLGQAYIVQGKWADVLAEVPPDAPKPEQTAVMRMMRGTAQAALKDAPAARASLDAAEQDAPRNADVRMAYARLALSLGDRKLAGDKADAALALDAKRADALHMKGELLASTGNLEGGLALMDQAVAYAPNESSFRLDRASLLLNMGQDAKARADVDAVLARDPKNVVATYLSMVLYVRAGKFPDADTALVAIDPVIARFQRGLFFAALIKANRGQAAQAEDLARRYVSRVPADAEGARLLARLLIASNKPDQAVKTLEPLVGAGRSDPETLDLLGRAYGLVGRPADAARALQQASTLAPQSAEILARLASTKMQLGDVAGATTALERSQAIAPAQPGVSEALVAAALRGGELDRAEDLLGKLRQQSGETEQVGLLTGLIRLARMDTEGARAAMQSTVDKFPQSANAKLNLAKVLLLSEKREDAITMLKALLAKTPADAQALSLLVQVLVQGGRGPEAVAAADAARAAAPNDTGITAGAAELAARLGDPARGLAIIDSMRQGGGPVPPILLPLLARLNVAAGKPDAAKAAYQQLLAANAGNLEARRGLVDLLVSTGDVPGAQTSLRDGLRAAPSNLGMQTALVQLEQRAKGLDAALALADQLRRDPAAMPSAAVLKGDLYMGAQRAADARTAYAAEYKATPTAPLALRMATADTAAGKPADAYADLKAYQDTQPTDPDVAQSLGALDVAAHRYKEAERNLNLVLGVRPNDPVALNNLAWAYQAQGDKRGRALAQRAYMEAPSPELADTLGWILLTDGEAASALPLLQQASAQRPANRTMKFHLASALNAANRREEAIAMLRPLVDDPAEFDDKAAARKLLADLTAK